MNVESPSEKQLAYHRRLSERVFVASRPAATTALEKARQSDDFAAQYCAPVTKYAANVAIGSLKAVDDMNQLRALSEQTKIPITPSPATATSEQVAESVAFQLASLQLHKLANQTGQQVNPPLAGASRQEQLAAINAQVAQLREIPTRTQIRALKSYAARGFAINLQAPAFNEFGEPSGELRPITRKEASSQIEAFKEATKAKNEAAQRTDQIEGDASFSSHQDAASDMPASALEYGQEEQLKTPYLGVEPPSADGFSKRELADRREAQRLAKNPPWDIAAIRSEVVDQKSAKPVTAAIKNIVEVAKTFGVASSLPSPGQDGQITFSTMNETLGFLNRLENAVYVAAQTGTSEDRKHDLTPRSVQRSSGPLEISEKQLDYVRNLCESQNIRLWEPRADGAFEGPQRASTEGPYKSSHFLPTDREGVTRLIDELVERGAAVKEEAAFTGAVQRLSDADFEQLQSSLKPDEARLLDLRFRQCQTREASAKELGVAPHSLEVREFIVRHKADRVIAATSSRITDANLAQAAAASRQAQVAI